MIVYTDEQLKQALVKLLPTGIHLRSSTTLYWGTADQPLLDEEGDLAPISDTELLHLCWLVEETLERVGDESEPPEIRGADIEWNRYCEELLWIDGSLWTALHASWQQRVTGLAKVRGVEIV